MRDSRRYKVIPFSLIKEISVVLSDYYPKGSLNRAVIPLPKNRPESKLPRHNIAGKTYEYLRRDIKVNLENVIGRRATKMRNRGKLPAKPFTIQSISGCPLNTLHFRFFDREGFDDDEYWKHLMKSEKITAEVWNSRAATAMKAFFDSPESRRLHFHNLQKSKSKNDKKSKFDIRQANAMPSAVQE